MVNPIRVFRKISSKTLWDRTLIREGVALTERALKRGCIGAYQLQAAIIAVYAEAPSFAKTDWQQIAWLCAELARGGGNPVYELNRIVAISYAEGAEAALACLKPIALALAGYPPFYAVQADLLVRAGRPDEAKIAYRRAIELSQSDAERRFLNVRLEALTAPA